MRMPRVRFTVRTAVALVAFTALALGVVESLRRASRYRALATYHAIQEDQLLGGEPVFLIEFTHQPNLLKTLTGLRDRAKTFRREAAEARRKLAEAQGALAAMRAAGRATAQSDRREPWYWQIRAEEAEWSAGQEEGEIAFHEARLGYHTRMKWAYDRASSRPWETVAVEHPPPDKYVSPGPYRPPTPPD